MSYQNRPVWTLIDSNNFLLRIDSFRGSGALISKKCHPLKKIQNVYITYLSFVVDRISSPWFIHSIFDFVRVVDIVFVNLYMVGCHQLCSPISLSWPICPKMLRWIYFGFDAWPYELLTEQCKQGSKQSVQSQIKSAHNKAMDTLECCLSHTTFHTWHTRIISRTSPKAKIEAEIWRNWQKRQPEQWLLW